VFDQSVFERSPILAGTRERLRAVRAHALARALLVGLPALWAVAYFFPPLNHDVAALLQFAQRMLHGGRLYVDLIDINPPMIFLLDTIPVALAELVRLPTVTCYVVFVLALVALSFAASVELLNRLGEGRRPLDALLWPALIGFALLVYPMHSFGQREHLLLIFVLPYALTAAARADGQALPRGAATASALFALPGIMLKPHFALVPLALELMVLARAGWRAWASSPQPWLILGGCLAYLVGVRLLLPEYFSVILPLVAQCYEQFSIASLLDLATRDQAPALLLPLIPLAVIAWRLPNARLARAMVALALAATGAGLLQGKGWDYHFFAARGAVVLAFGAVIADGLAQLWSGRPAGGRPARDPSVLGRVAPIAIATTVVALMFAFSGVLNPPFKGPRNFVNTAAARFLPVVSANAAGRPVLWLTTSIYPQFPVLNYTESALAMPFMSLWVLPSVYGADSLRDGAIAYHAPATMSRPEALVWRGVVDGFTRTHPALVLVEQASREGAFHGLPFDYLDYFLRDPGFAAEWSNYTLLTKVDNVSIYRRR
jgi:hypothetical protein